MTGAAPPRLRDGTAVAAWLFKAKPEVWDVLGALDTWREDPSRPIDTWSMAESYRVDLVRPGQRCALWVTGGRHADTTGVWAIGRVADAPAPDVEAPPGRPRYEVGLDLTPLDRAVRLVELLDDGRFARAEIIRAPRVSSPVALTAEEWSAITDRLPAWWVEATDH